MKTAYMGFGDVIVSLISHPKCHGKLILFSKAKRRLPILEIKEYEKNPIGLENVGKGLFQIYFPNKESLKRLIDHLTMMYKRWGE